MPTWILWLSPVIVAPLLAVAWISWVSRPKAPEQARETVEQYDRFRAALKDPAPKDPALKDPAPDEKEHRAS